MTTEMQPPPWGQGQPMQQGQQGWGAPPQQAYAQPTDPWGQQQAAPQYYPQQAPPAQQVAAPPQNLPAPVQQAAAEVATVQPTLTAAEVRDANLDSGLDDFGIEELRIPRIKILHPDGMFKESVNETVFPILDCVVLGFVRQRIFWPKDVDEGGKDDQPICKSNDSERGMPNTDTRSLRVFPWAESNFNPNLVVPDRELNRVMLPCQTCNFKEWGGTSKMDRKPPRCSEVWNLIVMYAPYGDAELVPAFLALKRSTLKSLKAYLATFKQRGLPAYSVWTRITLERHTRGTVVYSDPQFQAIAPTDRADLPTYSDNFRRLADYAKMVRPAEGGAAIGVQQEFAGAGFPQQGYAPQPGVVPQTVAQMQGQVGPDGVYYPQPMGGAQQGYMQQPYPQQAPQQPYPQAQYPQQFPPNAMQQPYPLAPQQFPQGQMQAPQQSFEPMPTPQPQQPTPPAQPTPPPTQNQAAPTPPPAPAAPAQPTPAPQAAPTPPPAPQAVQTPPPPTPAPPAIPTPPPSPVVQTPPAPPVVQAPPPPPAPAIPAVSTPPSVPAAPAPTPPAPPVESAASPASPAGAPWAGGAAGGDDDDEELPW